MWLDLRSVLEPYFWWLCNLTLEGVFTAQVLYPDLSMTIKGANGMVIWPGLHGWVWSWIVVARGRMREFRNSCDGERVSMYLPLSF